MSTKCHSTKWCRNGWPHHQLTLGVRCFEYVPCTHLIRTFCNKSLERCRANRNPHTNLISRKSTRYSLNATSWLFVSVFYFLSLNFQSIFFCIFISCATSVSHSYVRSTNWPTQTQIGPNEKLISNAHIYAKIAGGTYIFLFFIFLLFFFFFVVVDDDVRSFECTQYFYCLPIRCLFCFFLRTIWISFARFIKK